MKPPAPATVTLLVAAAFAAVSLPACDDGDRVGGGIEAETATEAEAGGAEAPAAAASRPVTLGRATGRPAAPTEVIRRGGDTGGPRPNPTPSAAVPDAEPVAPAPAPGVTPSVSPASLPVLDADAITARPVTRPGGRAASDTNGDTNDAPPPGLAVLAFRQSASITLPDAGATLANLLLADAAPDRFRLFERGQVQALLDEQRFQETDLVTNAARAARFGRLAGIRYLVVGELSVLGRLRWTARVLDCETGAILDKGSVSFDRFRDADAAVREMLARLNLGDAGLAGPATASDVPAGDADPLLDGFNPAATFGLSLATADGHTEYEEGDTVGFRVTPDAPGFLTLLSIDPAGDLTLLVPNRWQREPYLAAGQTLTLPAPDMGFVFPVQPPHGVTRVRAILTARPLPLTGVSDGALDRDGFVAGGNAYDGTRGIGVAAASATECGSPRIVTTRVRSASRSSPSVASATSNPPAQRLISSARVPGQSSNSASRSRHGFSPSLVRKSVHRLVRFPPTCRTSTASEFTPSAGRRCRSASLTRASACSARARCERNDLATASVVLIP